MLKLVLLDSGDAALIVNDLVVMTADPDFDKPAQVESVAERLSEALGVALLRIQRAAPACPEGSEPDWTWDGLAEELAVEAVLPADFDRPQSDPAADSSAQPQASLGTAQQQLLRMNVSLNGGATFQPALSGVRIVYEAVPLSGEDGQAQLHLTASLEGLVSDLWATDGAQASHIVGTRADDLDSLVSALSTSAA